MDTSLEILISAKDVTGKAFTSARSGVKGLTSAVFSLESALLGLGVGVVSDQLWDAGIAAEKLTYSFNAIEGDAAKGASELEFLRQTADDLGVEFYNVAGGYKGMLAASKGTVFEGGLIRDVFTGITEAGVALRMSNDDIDGSLRAVEQMMSKGKVQAEELRGQLGERLPGAFKLAADSMGLTTSELDKQLELGKVLASDLLPSLAVALHEKYGKAAAEAGASASAEMARFKTEWMDLKVELAESGFMDVAIDILGDVKTEFSELGEWVSTHGEEVEDFFETSGELIKTLGTAAVFAVEKTAGLTQWLADISAAAGLASSGLISITDIPLNADALHNLIETFNLDPAITQLESDANRIQEKISLLERELVTFDPAFDQAMISKLSVRRSGLVEELDALRSQIASMKTAAEVVPPAKEIEKSTKAVKAFTAAVEQSKKARGKKTGSDKDKEEKEAADATAKYNAYLLSAMDKTTEAYQDAFIFAEVAKWRKVKGITQEQLDDINFIIVDSFKKPADEIEGLFKGITENFTEAVQSEMSGIFTDTLTGELDSFEDYFESFTQSLSSMWGAMASKMVLEQTMSSMTGGAAGAAYGAAGWGGMAAAGGVLYGLNRILSGRSKKKAEERRRRQQRDQLNAQLTDSIAQMTLSDIGYEIFQTSTKLNEMAVTARKTGADLDKLNEYRELEIERLKEETDAYYDQQISAAVTPYNTIIDRYDSWKTDREQSDWGLSEWTAEIETLNQQFSELTAGDDAYFEVAEKQLDAMMTLVDFSEKQLASYENTQKSINAQIWDLTVGDPLGPVSPDAYQDRYDELLVNAKTLDVDAIGEFQSYVTDYLGVMDSAGENHAQTASRIAGDLGQLSVDLDDPITALKDAVISNTTATWGNTTSLDLFIADLMAQRDEARNIALRDSFIESTPERVGTDAPPNIAGGDGAMYDAIPKFEKNPQLVGNYVDAAELWLEEILGWSNKTEIVNQEGLQDWFAEKPQSGDYFGEMPDLPRLSGNNYDKRDDMDKYERQMENWLAGYDLYLDEMEDWTKNIPAFAYGGWTDSIGLVGEAGPEYIVPDRDNPNNQHFLDSVGANPVKIGETVSKQVIAAMTPIMSQIAQSGGGDRKIVIQNQIIINERLLGDSVSEVFDGGHEEAIRAVRSVVN